MILDLFIIIILSLLGIFLLIAEIFIIPGFGVAGIAGFIFMGGSVWYAYDQLGPTGGNITFLIAGIGFLVMVYLFVKSKMVNRMALKKEIKSNIENTIDSSIVAGDEAMTISILNPMGSVLVKGMKIEAKSPEGFIDVNSRVIIEKVEKTKVIVRLA